MASAIQAARAAIEGRLNANWTTTPIAWPGQDFDPGAADWVRSTIRFGETTLSSHTSSGHNLLTGTLFLDVFTRGKGGYGTLYGYVDTLRDLYDRATVGAVEFLAAYGPRDISDELWRGLQLEVPFVIEETS